MNLSSNDRLAIELAIAIRRGGLGSVVRLLRNHRGLARARIKDARGISVTPLHFVAQAPGYFPDGPRVTAELLARGADPNARTVGDRHRETPLHLACTTDDVEVAAALIEGGCDTERPGGSFRGGRPLEDAVGYGNWRVARLLVARGARVNTLWLAAALGMTSAVREQVESPTPPGPNVLSDAFWHACHGGHRRIVEYLLSRGANPSWIPSDEKRSPVEIAATPEPAREALGGWLAEILSASKQHR